MSKSSSRITSISPDYETCLECRVSLLIYPDKIHPDDVSSILNMEPTQKNIIGEKKQ